MREEVRGRAWDLIEGSDARLFLVGTPLLPFAAELPTPSRAILLTAPAPPLPTPEPGLALLQREGYLLAAGPAAALATLCETWQGELGRLARTLLARYERPPAPLRFADGESWELVDAARVMGILNVTPDSFSDGGRHDAPSTALAHAENMLEEGADIIDVGGESTRPGAAPVAPEAEAARVVPVIDALRKHHPRCRISIDTRRAEVARAALDAGADLVNDVSALADPAMAALVAERGVPLCLMHMRGEPGTMQNDTRYRDLVGEVLDFLAARAEIAHGAGISSDRILVDPGIGFAKSAVGNEVLLRQLGCFRSLGLPLLVGVSRKSFIGKRTLVESPDGRLGGSLSAAVAALLGGARILRVHDVRASREALTMADALRRWPAPHEETS